MPMPRSSGALLVGDSTPLFCSFMSEVYLSSNTIAESTAGKHHDHGVGWWMDVWNFCWEDVAKNFDHGTCTAELVLSGEKVQKGIFFGESMCFTPE